MNCHKAHQFLFAEPDGVVPPGRQIALQAHLEECSVCRKARSSVTDSMASWRTSIAAVDTPDVEKAWQDIRRATRRGQPTQAVGTLNSFRWVAPLGIAAGLALVASVTPRWQNNAQAAPTAQREVAHADFVDVPNDASSMVYVDDQSGWLVVWSYSESQPSGG